MEFVSNFPRLTASAEHLGVNLGQVLIYLIAFSIELAFIRGSE